MANPIAVNVAITSQNTTLYMLVDTYAAYTQKATIQTPNGAPFNGQPIQVSGNGEGTRILYRTFQVPAPGIYTFNVLMQFDNGTGFKNSSQVQQANFAAVTLNQTIVFSEDAGDNDDNDCILTFMWFNRVTQAAAQ